ncbi:6-phosphogluconate dehydrogenase, decarboxylating [Glycine soja]|uniref:phosphogluconate dehydrogenase (NADP(+)-dependent, decarboxylating) n=1 Tax=Glycine soja TaxID=3848 RepID=A0A0B2QJ86_GLYSO|nr:6-phosphogluconate dehydrogenase, decarboxylating [Glycine soja]
MPTPPPMVFSHLHPRWPPLLLLQPLKPASHHQPMVLFHLLSCSHPSPPSLFIAYCDIVWHLFDGWVADACQLCDDTGWEVGVGVSGGEEGACGGPHLMPGGLFEAFKYMEDILLKVVAQVPNSGPCVTYIGKCGSSKFMKMIHNGIEYANRQLIAEAYDVLKSVGKLSNKELQSVFLEWNKGELLSFLIKIIADIFGIKDDKGDGYLVDKVLDKTNMKGIGKWTVQQAVELSIVAPTIEA